MSIPQMTVRGRPIKLSEAQRYFLQHGETGFTRLMRMGGYKIRTGFNIYTVAGLIRRGWLDENDHGIIRTSDLGKMALRCDLGEFQGQTID